MSVTVSIIVATRNRTDLLERALRSIARQRCRDMEVIVVDDGSRREVLEHSERLMADLGERFRLLRPVCADARGSGPSAARNRGAKAASGEFIAFLDDDDEWVFDDYLEAAVSSLNEHDADYFFGHLEGNRGGVVQDPGWVPPPDLLCRERLVGDSPPVHSLSRETAVLVSKRFMIHPSNSIVRAQLFVRTGGFFEGLWSHAEDLNLMLRIIDGARLVLYTPRTVASYRLPTADSISLTEQEGAHMLQRILAAQHARLHCVDPQLRDSARARESWTYREMATAAFRAGRRQEARAFERQCFATYPTVGTAAFVVKRWLGAR